MQRVTRVELRLIEISLSGVKNKTVGATFWQQVLFINQ